MSTATLEVTPKVIFGYALFCIGLIMLSYVTMNCVLLANGTVEPLIVSEEPISYGLEIAYGVMLQIGAYALLIVISYVLIKTGLSIART